MNLNQSQLKKEATAIDVETIFLYQLISMGNPLSFDQY